MPAALHILASRVVERALADGAVIHPVRHYADITELDRLARDITCPPVAEEMDLLDAPIVIDDVLLRRLSWAGREWLATSAYEWWKDEGSMLDLSYAWAFAHSREKALMQSVRVDRRGAEKIIRRWARGTTASYDAIMAACRYLSNNARRPDKPPADDKNPNYIGQVLLTLITETHRPLDYWIYEAPAELVAGTLAQISENLRADQARLIRALGKDVPPDPHSWHVKASDRFTRACRAFREKLGLPLRGPKAKPDEAGVGSDETAVGAGEGEHDRGAVQGRDQVDDDGHAERDGRDQRKNPPRNSENEEQRRAPGANVGDLGPAGEDQ